MAITSGVCTVVRVASPVIMVFTFALQLPCSGLDLVACVLHLGHEVDAHLKRVEEPHELAVAWGFLVSCCNAPANSQHLLVLCLMLRVQARLLRLLLPDAVVEAALHVGALVIHSRCGLRESIVPPAVLHVLVASLVAALVLGLRVPLTAVHRAVRHVAALCGLHRHRYPSIRRSRPVAAGRHGDRSRHLWTQRHRTPHVR
mmetsp:Transcript_32854/g.71700  ORF Transcript_32854/g.71700 Transcript_32854/m.71700 type:complete len:201 (-) Transcript_32854:216-818(-)